MTSAEILTFLNRVADGCGGFAVRESKSSEAGGPMGFVLYHPLDATCDPSWKVIITQFWVRPFDEGADPDEVRRALECKVRAAAIAQINCYRRELHMAQGQMVSESSAEGWR